VGSAKDFAIAILVLAKSALHSVTILLTSEGA